MLTQLAGLDPRVVAVLAATLVVGAAVQGLVGLGLGLVAAPVVTLLEPRLMPELMLWLALLLPVVTLARERQEIDWHALRWALAARVPGTAVGVVLVSWFSARALGVAVAMMVLLSVLVTARAVVVPVNRTSLAVAGLFSGVSGTATSIGGPPLALLLQHRTVRQVRTTLAVYFLVGALLSLTGLALADRLHLATLVLALGLVPCLVVGFAVSRLLHGHLSGRRARTAILLVCAASAVVLLGRSLA